MMPGFHPTCIAHTHTAWLKWSFLFWLSQFGAILLILWRV